MYKLQPVAYARTRAIFDPLRYNLVVDSVIEGNTPAWVYVDDVEEPRVAWMWDRQDAMLLAGSSQDLAVVRSLADLIHTQVAPDAQSRYIPYLTLAYAPAEWELRLDVLLEGWQPEVVWRRFYDFGGVIVDWRARVPQGCEMRRMDAALLADEGWENLNQVLGWIQSFWTSLDDFLQTGFGFCLLKGDVIASWCLSVFVSGTQYEVGLATVPDYWGQGFATLVAAASVDYCVTHGLTPHWHCDEKNVPSLQVAEKVGFENPTRYTVYGVEL